MFSVHFLNRVGSGYFYLKNIINKYDPSSMRYLLALKTQLKRDVFTEERILLAVESHTEVVKMLFKDFVYRHKAGIIQFNYTNL